MYLTRSEYDRGVNTFSPEGRLFQVEYAIEAIKLGSTAIGLQTKSGSVLAVEKRLTSSLLEPSSVEKIAEIDTHVGAAMSGLVADARTLVDHARVEAQNHRFTYDEPIGVEALTQGEFRWLVFCSYCLGVSSLLLFNEILCVSVVLVKSKIGDLIHVICVKMSLVAADFI